MRGAMVTRLDGPEGIEVIDIENPESVEGKALLDVKAVGLSFPDLLLAQGKYQISPDIPFPIGTEFAGVLLENMPERGLTAGERVAGVAQYGAAVERFLATPQQLLPVPSSLSDEQAAAMPLAFLTAHLALVVRGQAKRGHRVLVDGASGGVGSALVQVAKALGCHVVALVRGGGDVTRVQNLGADAVLTSVSAAEIREVSGGGIDIAVDVVGSEELVLESLRSLRQEGRLLTLGFAGGSIPKVKLNRLLLGNVDVRGVSWGPYSRAHSGFAQEQWREVAEWLREGRISPPAVDVYPLTRASQALSVLQRGGTQKRVVLSI